MSKEIITWGQAISLNQLKPIGEKHLETVRAICMYYGKNTAAQLLDSALYMEALELFTPLMEKDYSKFLFEKVESLSEEFEKKRGDLDKLKETMQKVAKINMDVINNEEKKKKS